MVKSIPKNTSKDSPKVSIIVPTYNSNDNIKLFLDALTESNFKDFEVIVNDDNRTSDSTERTVKSFSKLIGVVYIKKNKMMAQARKEAAKSAKGHILIHLDSDMRVTPALLGECVNKIDKEGFDALVIPEESIGIGFWSKCKWLEKKMYEGVSRIESLRVVKKEIYYDLGGHDEAMVFSEDKDFDIRVREAGYRVGRVKNHLLHDEGRLRLFRTLRKKLYYSNTANVFASKHPEHFKWQANPFNRYVIYIKNVKFIFIHPLLYVGAWTVKTLEYIFSLFGYVIKILRTP